MSQKHYPGISWEQAIWYFRTNWTTNIDHLAPLTTISDQLGPFGPSKTSCWCKLVLKYQMDFFLENFPKGNSFWDSLYLYKGAGSFHIHRKTMRELCILAVLGIRERPNLAQNLVTHRHWWKNIFRAITLPLWRVFGQNLAIFAHFWAFSITFLVVTAINMLTLGIGRTCIFHGHIPSWFEAVLAFAMLQLWTRGPQKWAIWGSKTGHNGRFGLGQGFIIKTL